MFVITLNVLKIGLLQLNSTVGDFVANRQKLVAGYEWSVALGTKFMLAPELFLWGYARFARVMQHAT